MSLRKVAATLVLTAIFAITGFGADATLLSFVLPDAKVVAGAYVDRDVQSPFGQFALAQVSANGDALKSFIEQTGVDPTRDISEVMVSSNAAGGFLGAAKGHFDVDALVAKMQAAGAQLSTYNDAKVLTMNADNQEYSRAVALLEMNYVIAGTADGVRAAIDRRFQPAAFDATLAAKVAQVSSANDAWFATNQIIPPGVTVNQPANPAGIEAMVLPIIQNITMLSGGVVFGTDVKYSAEAITASDKDAQSLTLLLQLAMAMAQMQASSNPQIAQVASLLQGLKVTPTGNAVAVSLSVPEAQLEQIIGTLKTPTKQGAQVRRKRT